MKDIIKIEKRVPKISEYKYLCNEVGWSNVMNIDAAKDALPNSVYGVTLVNSENQAIGMGRIVGDGFIYFYIQDIVVIPKYQKQGYGKLIMDELIFYIKENAPEKSFIGLFSVGEATAFYEKYTLKERDLIGMFTVKEIIMNSEI